MSTDMIIQHCSPTLARLKTANLFNCKYNDINDLCRKVDSKNKLLNCKGVYFTILRDVNGVALILVFRKRMLQDVLQQQDIQLFLKEYGYTDFRLNECLELLRSHLLQNDFPHEIGVFLGYPLYDIKEFIRQKGRNCKCCGCWKVYGDVECAQNTFKKFKKCTRIYCDKFLQGFDINRLTVVG